MQFSMILSATMAVLAAAAPQGVTRRTDGGSCNANSQQVCCNGVANCIVQVLESTCSNEAYCCVNNSPIGALIAINALNCVKL